MAPKCLKILALLIIPVISMAQSRVVRQESLPYNPSFQFSPDIEGNILMTEEFSRNLENPKNVDTVSLYPYWPQQKPGGTELGGVYADLDGDGQFEMIYCIGQKVYAWDLNAFMVPGWPRDLDFPSDGAPSFGDIDGDGLGEIVVATHQPGSANIGSLYAFEINGSNTMGFPVTLNGGAIKTPVLADLDGDGKLEIIVAVRQWPDGFIYVYYGNGTEFPNWPQRMDYVPASSVAVGDVNGDSIPEIVAESYYRLHVYKIDGTLLPGFPFTPGAERVFSYSSPVLADLDGDGYREIIFGDHGLSAGDGRVYAMKYDGTSLAGWPKVTSYWIYGPPAVADIDGDGFLDIAVGDQILSQTPICKVYAWDALTAQPLPGFPIENLNAVNNQIIISDLDGDGMLDLMFDDNTSAGVYLGYKYDGTPMDGWPIHVNGATFYINPVVIDLNGDGLTDISGGGYVPDDDNSFIYIWNANVDYQRELAVLPILQYNTRHNGVYGDNLMVGIADPPAEKSLPDFTISPNPAGEYLIINFILQGSESVEFSLIATSGERVWKSDQIQAPNDQNSLEVSLAGIPNGLYTCEMATPLRKSAKKVVILK